MAGFAVVHPLVAGRQYSSIARESVLQAQGQWIIQFDIINHEAKDVNYKLVWVGSGETSTENVMAGQGQIYTYIHHIYLNTLKEGIVNLTIYKEGDTAPFEQVTYHLN